MMRRIRIVQGLRAIRVLSWWFGGEYCFYFLRSLVRFWGVGCGEREEGGRENGADEMVGNRN